MKPVLRPRIREIRLSKIPKITLESVAEKFGTTRGHISKIEKGEVLLNSMWIQRFCDFYDCEPNDLFEYEEEISELETSGMSEHSVQFRNAPAEKKTLRYSSRTQTPVVAYIGAGDEIFPVDDHALGDGLEMVDTPVGLEHLNIVAAKIKGASMPPFKDGWLVFWTKNCEGVDMSECLNKLCAVQLADGRFLFKELRRGFSPGRFNLISYAREPIEDVEITWAAKVLDIRPI